MPNSTFGTCDIALAAYLVMAGHQLVSTERLRAGKYNFNFADYQDREKEVISFFNRKTRVEPNAFLDHIKSLKSLIQQ